MWKDVFKISVVAIAVVAFVLTFSVVSKGADVGISDEEMELLAKGREIFYEKCAVCHGFDGVPELPEAPNFAEGERFDKTDEELIETINNGKDIMPPWKDVISDEEILQALSFAKVIYGDSIFGNMCIDCHDKFVPALSGDVPRGADLVKASEGVLEFCSDNDVEADLEPVEAQAIVKFIRTFQEKD